MATLVIMTPGLGRLVEVDGFLPDFGLNGADARHFYELLLILPALVYDTVRRGMPHRAFCIALTLLLAYMIAAHFMWDSPWWQAKAPSLLGGG